MIGLILKNILRSHVLKTGVLLLFGTGLLSLWIGFQFQQRLKSNVEESALHQQESLIRLSNTFQDDLGYMLYYAKFSLFNELEALSGLVIGQRDINPSLKSFTIRGLEAQKYDAELKNPVNALLGNLDYAFVLIYLFPLLIIALCFNIITEEKETGTWSIIAVQEKRTFTYLGLQYGIRYCIVMIVLALLFLVATPLFNISPDSRLLNLVWLSSLYVLVWFSICIWVTSINKSSSQHAIFLLCLWLGLLVLLPTAMNNYISYKYPIQEAFVTTLTQRKAYHEKWDSSKELTMEKFYSHYPQFKEFKISGDDFSWLLYYAMQQVGDDEALTASKKFKEKLNVRNNASRLLSQFIPSIYTQLQLEELAGTGLDNQLDFLNHCNQFHEKLRLFFYPKIFGQVPSTHIDWNTFSIKHHKGENSQYEVISGIPLIMVICLFGFLGYYNIQRKTLFKKS